MKYRSTIIYLVITLLLGGLYLWDVTREKKKEAREEEARVLFPDLESEKVKRIELSRGDETVILRRIAEDASEKSWTIASPVKTAADDFSVHRITSLLPHLQHTRVIAQDPEDPAAFGLKDPAFTLAWKTDEEEGFLSVGEESPIDKDFYATTGEGGPVFLLPAANKSVLDKSLYDLRDKKLFTVASDEVKRFTIERPPESWTFARSGETAWALEGEPEFPVDSEGVDTALRRLTWEEAASFEEERAEDLEPYGLNRPSFRIALSDGDTIEELLVGASADGGEPRRYARMADSPSVVTLRERVLEELPASLEEFRRETEEEEDQTTEQGE